VASNSTYARLEKSLGLLPLWGRFAPAIYSAEMVARPKPAPDLPLHCARAFNARPERCVMIDDSPHGVTATRLAGMIPIGFVDPADPRPGRADILREAGARFVVTGAAELPEALAGAARLVPV
jgi:beta-phosphoglucomutase-like phosphatase (HAD superfamily)